MKISIHQALTRTIGNEDRTVSLCGRSSKMVINVMTISSGQNLTDDTAKVTCKFCLNILAKQGGWRYWALISNKNM